jgi:hypothetical protein
VEAASHYRHRPTLGDRLARHTADQSPAVVAEAWRAQQRLDAALWPSPRRQWFGGAALI